MKLYHWKSTCFEAYDLGGIVVIAKSVEEARAKGLVAGLIELGRDIDENGQPVNSDWVIDELKADLAAKPAITEAVVYWGVG